MIQKIVKKLDELGFVREEQKSMLLAMSVPELMEEFVFPRCLCLPRSGVRYPRINGRFMELMTWCGEDFLAADYKLGSILLECAMQRISRHPSLPAIDYVGNLPKEYREYSAASMNPEGINGCPDEPGLWGSEEIHFLLFMLPVCLKLKEPKYADHAKLIVFQMVSLLGSGNFLWLKDTGYCNVNEEDAWLKAAVILCEAGLEREFVDYCVGKGWRVGVKFFRESFFRGDHEEYLLSKIDLKQENYYQGFKRKALMWLGLYDRKTRECILKNDLRRIN